MNIFPIVNSVKCTKGLEGCNRKQPGTNLANWQTGKPGKLKLLALPGLRAGKKPSGFKPQLHSCNN